MGASADRPLRSPSAQTAQRAAAVARQRRAQSSGWWGMALFLCAEVTLFGTLIATYFYLDFGAHSWPPAGIKGPSVILPLISVGVLIAMSGPLVLAVRATQQDDSGARRRVCWLIVAAVAVQTCYLALQILLFRHDLLRFSPQATAYGSIYFTLLAAHHAHVLLGILIELVVLWQVAVHGMSNYWLIGVRCAALYWHVVNVLAVLVVLTQLSPTL